MVILLTTCGVLIDLLDTFQLFKQGVQSGEPWKENTRVLLWLASIGKNSQDSMHTKLDFTSPIVFERRKSKTMQENAKE